MATGRKRSKTLRETSPVLLDSLPPTVTTRKHQRTSEERLPTFVPNPKDSNMPGTASKQLQSQQQRTSASNGSGSSAGFTPQELLERNDQAGSGFQPVDTAKLRATNKRMGTSVFKVMGVPARMVLRGTLITHGISFHESEEYGDKFSIGMVLNDEADKRALQSLNAYVPQVSTEGEEAGWTIKELFKEDSDALFLKCKTNPERTVFQFKSNLPLHPKKQNVNIYQNMALEVYAQLGAYFVPGEDTCGLYVTLQEVNFLAELPPTREMGTQTEAAEESVEDQPAPKKSKQQVGKGWGVRGVENSSKKH